MLADLPKPIQEQILYYLEANNFQAAKELHDRLLVSKSPSQSFNTETEAEAA